MELRVSLTQENKMAVDQKILKRSLDDVRGHFAFMNYTDKEHRIKKNIAGLMLSQTKSHSWLWAQHTQVIDSHCFHMQLLTTTFLFTIIHEDNTSENRQRQCSFSIINLTECQEALSEGQFVKQTHGTYFVWSWRLTYWFLRVLGTLPMFSRTFPQTMKPNHSVLSLDGGVYGDSYVC